MKKVFAVILTVVMAAALFAACSSCKKEEAAAATPEGVYHLETINGKAPLDYVTDYTGGSDMLPVVLGMIGLTTDDISGNFLTAELKADGTVEFSGAYLKLVGAESASGTWTLEGNKLTVNIKGEKEAKEFTFENNTITGTYQNLELVLKK